MKFKVGDKVRVKDSSKVLHSQYRGRVGKITAVALFDVDEHGYEVDFAPGSFIIGYQYGGRWIGEKTDRREGVIIAWMPLPEPPVKG